MHQEANWKQARAASVEPLGDILSSPLPPPPSPPCLCGDIGAPPWNCGKGPVPRAWSTLSAAWRGTSLRPSALSAASLRVLRA